MTNSSNQLLLSLVFAPGTRPDVALLRRSGAGGADGFAVTLEAVDEQDHWAELLASGLTFDCHGLAPGSAPDLFVAATLLGLASAPLGEAIALQPGPHIASGASLLPVVQVLLTLAAELAKLPGVQAVCWHPAECCMSPDYFARIVADWRAGGAFPALGLTALIRQDDGALASRGLNFFLGQELLLSSELGLAPEAAGKLAIRLIDQLVALGAVIEPRAFALAGQPEVLALPDRSGTLLAITRPLHVR